MSWLKSLRCSSPQMKPVLRIRNDRSKLPKPSTLVIRSTLFRAAALDLHFGQVILFTPDFLARRRRISRTATTNAIGSRSQVEFHNSVGWRCEEDLRGVGCLFELFGVGGHPSWREHVRYCVKVGFRSTHLPSEETTRGLVSSTSRLGQLCWIP